MITQLQALIDNCLFNKDLSTFVEKLKHIKTNNNLPRIQKQCVHLLCDAISWSPNNTTINALPLIKDNLNLLLKENFTRDDASKFRRFIGKLGMHLVP